MLRNNYTQKDYRSYHVILPASQQEGALILGDLNAATDLQLIKTYKIKAIITAACGLQHLKIPPQLTHVVFPLLDTKQQNIQMYFELSNSTIEENLKKGAVLVHCGAGISRSASLVIAYYMKRYNLTFKNALSRLKKIKPTVCPNLGFQLQLKKYQNDLGLQDQERVLSKRRKPDQKQLHAVTYSQFNFDLPSITNSVRKTADKQKVCGRAGSKQISSISRTKQVWGKKFIIEGKGALDSIDGCMPVYEPSKYSRCKGWTSARR